MKSEMLIMKSPVKKKMFLKKKKIYEVQLQSVKIASPFPFWKFIYTTACNNYTTYTSNIKDHSLASYYVKNYSRTLFICCNLTNLILSAKTIDKAGKKKLLLSWLILKSWRTDLTFGNFNDCVLHFHLEQMLSFWLKVWWKQIRQVCFIYRNDILNRILLQSSFPCSLFPS